LLYTSCVLRIACTTVLLYHACSLYLAVFLWKYRDTALNDSKTKSAPHARPSYLCQHERKWS
ncbi:hypothetical protein PDJAM_G00055490, partial [Pangasius djambal]|nr:hypothetical protein [Pangasius djambal]